MSAKAVQWKEILLKAAERVQAVTDGLRSEGDRRKVMGTGAFGDKTLFADREAERTLIEALSSVKGLRVLSEEAGDVGNRDSRLLAILDPLDGSSNFERGIPFYCVSIAIVNGVRLKDVEVGFVRNLVTGDVYYAERGKGATKNDQCIKASGTAQIGEAVVGIDISRTNVTTITGLIPLIVSIKRQVHYGANALELCLVAEGLTDAFVDIRGRMRVVDFAGAYLIAKEAGAVVTSQSGARLDPDLDQESRFGLVASANVILHEQILQRLGVSASF